MKKRNFISGRLIPVLMALAVSMIFTGTVYAGDKHHECVRPGQYCFQVEWYASNDPAWTGVTYPVNGGIWETESTPVGDGSFLVSNFLPVSPATGVPSYCFGHTQKNGKQIVTTNYCQEGSIGTDYYTNTWIDQITFQCTDGVLATSGTWSSIYTYALPAGPNLTPPQPVMNGPYYGYGTSTLVPPLQRH